MMHSASPSPSPTSRASGSGGGGAGSGIKRRPSLRNSRSTRNLRISAPSRSSSITQKQRTITPPKYFFRVQGMLTDNDDGYYLGAKGSVISAFYDSDDPHRELRLSYAQMHSKFHRHPLRFCPFVSLNGDGDPTYGRCVVHVYTKDGNTWLGHLGVNAHGVLVVSHPPHDFLVQLAPQGVDVEDDTSGGSAMRQNDRFTLKWLNPESDDWVLICGIRKYLRFRWRAGAEHKGRPLFCFMEDPDKLQHLEVELAKTEATDKQKLEAQVAEHAELEAAYEKLQQVVEDRDAELKVQRHRQEELEQECSQLRDLQGKLRAAEQQCEHMKQERDEANLMLARAKRQSLLEVQELAAELEHARARADELPENAGSPPGLKANDTQRQEVVKCLTVRADASGRMVTYGARELEKLLDQRRTLSGAARTLQAQKVKLIEACKSLQRKADESVATQESLLKRVSQLQVVGLENEQLRHQVSNLTRQVERYHKREQARAEQAGGGMKKFNDFFKHLGAAANHNKSPTDGAHRPYQQQQHLGHGHGQ